jgi:hypothetical protein
MSYNIIVVFQYLPQNPAEKRAEFKVFVMKKSSTLTDFMRDEKISSEERDRVFYELLSGGLVHYVEVTTIDGSTVSETIIVYAWYMPACMQYVLYPH